jgi:hypothetical protein
LPPGHFGACAVRVSGPDEVPEMAGRTERTFEFANAQRLASGSFERTGRGLYDVPSGEREKCERQEAGGAGSPFHGIELKPSCDSRLVKDNS